MKKLFLCGLLLCIVLSSTGCAHLMIGGMILGMGTVQENDPATYGGWEKYHDAPGFLPESLDGVTVNQYSYTLYNYFDTCYEIFLDITVTADQFDTLIEEAMASAASPFSRIAFYDESYTELIFEDTYERGQIDTADGLEQVGWADIDKVIYNPDTCNIIYVAFHANDTGVHDLENVAYFKRFGITPEAYVNHLLPDSNYETKELNL